ncbi:MAG: NAD(P)-dependent oxidoreductase [archaeon]
MEKNVLITGGAGYIGSVMTRHLLDSGYKVTCVDNLMYGQQTPFLFSNDPNYEFIFGDARDEELIKKAISGKDVIIPLACLVGMPICKKKPFDAKSTNYEAVALLDRLRNHDQIVVYPTTNSGYGTKTGDMFCTEETPLEPISLYGETKVNAEKLLLQSDKPAVTLRLATVFGVSPRMRTDLLVNDFVFKAFRDGCLILFERHFKRNYIHIGDVAKGFLHVIENFESMKNEPYNLGLDEANLSKDELAHKIKEHLPGIKIYYDEFASDPDKRNYIVSNEKILKKGFKATVGLDEGIKELIRGYKVLLANNPYGND